MKRHCDFRSKSTTVDPPKIESRKTSYIILIQSLLILLILVLISAVIGVQTGGRVRMEVPRETGLVDECITESSITLPPALQLLARAICSESHVLSFTYVQNTVLSACRYLKRLGLRFRACGTSSLMLHDYGAT